MIYEALVVPTEAPPTLREIKRALLTYDRVLLVDPSDRELFPRNAFVTALMGLPLFGIDAGPVRPLGKTLGYDERFERTMEFCQVAISQNLLSVVSSFAAPETNNLTIGGVPLGGYPLSPTAVYKLYRGLANSQALLATALSDDISELQQQIRTTDGLALVGGADGSVNEGPTLPMADCVAGNEFAEPLTQIARARIGAILKYSGYCEAKSVIPVFGSRSYAATLDRILAQARKFLDAGTPDSANFRRSRVLDLAHEEFLVDQRLDALTVQEVIQLRTKGWGQQALAREKLFEAIFEIAESSATDEQYFDRAKVEIREYRKASETLLRERESLAMSIKCDLGVGTLAGGTTLIGLLSQLESPIQSVAVTLAAGGVWALEKAKDYVPKLREIQAQTADLKRGAGFAIHNFYSRLPSAA
jgi:hypothetical protein